MQEKNLKNPVIRTLWKMIYEHITHINVYKRAPFSFPYSTKIKHIGINLQTYNTLPLQPGVRYYSYMCIQTKWLSGYVMNT